MRYTTLSNISNNSTATTHPSSTLKRCLTATDLTMLGIGSIIGAGIFVLIGVATATTAGPGIMFSLVLAGVICMMVAVCYAELGSALGGCGGAYNYALYSCGKLCAWLVGWVLLLQYSFNVATVAVGWSGYITNVLHSLGINIPSYLTTDPIHNGYANIPAMLIIFTIAAILSLGTSGSARFNEILVAIKLTVIAIFIAIGSCHMNYANFTPFLPFGLNGIINGAGIIFFAFIGFDAISAASEETINPSRNVPLGILLSLGFCIIVYIMIAAVLLGIAEYSKLNNPSPLANALISIGHPIAGGIICLGAIAGITSSIMAMYYGLTRIGLAMSRDKLLPQFLVHIHVASATPRRLIWLASIIIAMLAGLLPILSMANLVNLCTLAIFIAVCTFVIILRITQPQLTRTFKTPWSPLIPLSAIGLCFYLMLSLSRTSWLCFAAWLLLGLLIYAITAKLKLSAKGEVL
jgi:APA family basic amino acid/polyamine antiporter